MVDSRRPYIFAVVTAKKSGSSPGKRHKYDGAFKAEALRLAPESRSGQRGSGPGTGSAGPARGQ